MTPTGLLLVFVLWILMPAAAIAVGIFVAWRAFRGPVLGARTLVIALAILVMPFILLAIIDPDGLEIAFGFESPYLLSIAAGIVIVIDHANTQGRRFRRSRQVNSVIDFVFLRPSDLSATWSSRISASFFLWLHRFS